MKVGANGGTMQNILLILGVALTLSGATYAEHKSDTADIGVADTNTEEPEAYNLPAELLDFKNEARVLGDKESEDAKKLSAALKAGDLEEAKRILIKARRDFVHDVAGHSQMGSPGSDTGGIFEAIINVQKETKSPPAPQVAEQRMPAAVVPAPRASGAQASTNFPPAPLAGDAPFYPPAPQIPR